MTWNCSRAGGENNLGRFTKSWIPDPLGPPGLISTLPIGFGPTARRRCNAIPIWGPVGEEYSSGTLTVAQSNSPHTDHTIVLAGEARDEGASDEGTIDGDADATGITDVSGTELGGTVALGRATLVVVRFAFFFLDVAASDGTTPADTTIARATNDLNSR
jgi:hypothetical protein